MRAEKVSIANEIKSRLEGVPYVILTDFTGLSVQAFSDLRERLSKANARAMVVKNSFLRRALKDLNLPEMNGALQGPTAVVYGNKDVSTVAAVLKSFKKEFQKPKIKAGILDRVVLSVSDLETIAELPPLDILRAQLLGLLSTPATTLVRLFNTPASQFAKVLKAKLEKPI